MAQDQEAFWGYCKEIFDQILHLFVSLEIEANILATKYLLYGLLKYTMDEEQKKFNQKSISFHY